MSLHAKHATLLRSLTDGPLPRNVAPRDAVAVLEELGTVERREHGHLGFEANGARHAFRWADEKELTVAQTSELRHVLLAITGRPGAEAPPAGGPVCVVVIDHHGARLYETEPGASRPEPEGSVAPHDPHGFHRHLIHRKEAHYKGDRVPEDHAFYDEVAAALRDRPAIVVIGHGTGKSDAAAVLVEALRIRHAETAGRIVGVETTDLSALTEPQIEAIALRHMAPTAGG